MTDKILQLILENKLIGARDQLLSMNIVDMAQLFEQLFQQENHDHLIVLFRILPKDIAAQMFSYLSPEGQRHIIESINDKEITYILDELFFDDMIDFIEELPANIVKKVLKNTDEHKRKLINHFLNYPDNSAGSIMTIEYVDLDKNMTTAQALEHIRKVGVDKETIETCYVIDENRKLEGIVTIRKLILSEKDVLVADIMDTHIIRTRTLDDQEVVADTFRKYDFLSMPVVDNENRLVGIITIDDIVDIIEAENTEDFEKMAAMQPSEEEYLKSSAFTLSKNRITWLLVLMISAVFAGAIIDTYQGLLVNYVVLNSFIPMLMGTGGNAGAQASTLIIRGLALGEIQLSDILQVLWKELRVSLVVGVVLAVVNFLRLYLLSGVSLLVSISVCVSLFFTIVIAKVVGSTLPIVAKKMKVDPAIMASPLITTIVDALALIIFFRISTSLLVL